MKETYDILPVTTRRAGKRHRDVVAIEQDILVQENIVWFRATWVDIAPLGGDNQ